MIQITDKYYFDTDKYNYILYKKHIVTESEAIKRKDALVGAEEFKPITYHSTLQNLLLKIRDLNKKNISLDTDLLNYIEILNKQDAEFLNQISEYMEVLKNEKI